MLGFPCFAPQYEILSILYDSPGLSNKGVRSVYNCSRSHFHRALGELVARGTIHRDLDERDRRVMKYRLDDGVSDALNNHFARSYRFIKARFLHGLPGALELAEDSCYTIC
jgi:DNA-binding MarR family transcriptional regulator